MRKSTKLLVLATSLLLVGTGLSVTSAVQCASNNTELQNSNTQLEQLLKDKEAELNDANAKNDEYEDLIASMENNIYYKANYYLGETLSSTEFVKKGENAVDYIQTDNQYLVHSCTLEDGTEVDISTFEFTEDTDFYFNYENRYKYNVGYRLPNKTTSGFTSYTVMYFANSEVAPEFEEIFSGEYDITKWLDQGWDFKYWLGTYSLTPTYPGDTIPFDRSSGNNQHLYVILGKEVKSEFKVDSNIYTTQNHILTTESSSKDKAKVDTTILGTPTKEGYIFKGWAIEGAEDTIIDLTTYTFQDNVTFVAVFEENV